MRRRVYRTRVNGPGVVAVRQRGDQVLVEYLGQVVQTVSSSEVRRGVAFPIGDGHELALIDGGPGNRTVVKLDGERLTPTATQFSWVGYAPWLVLGVAVISLVVAGLAYLGFEPAWRLAIRREALVVGVTFLALWWSRTRWTNPAASLILAVDLIWVLMAGIWGTVSLMLRVLFLAYFVRASYQEWQAIPD